jgi:GxxExxY protein
MTENQIAEKTLDIAFKIHRALGPGLYESAYSAVMALELQKEGLRFEREVPVLIQWDGVDLDVGYRADFIIEDSVIIEMKSLEELAPVHHKQVLTYVKVADKRLGLLINFGEELLKNGIFRIVNKLEE